ncbi:MAG TPA: glycosyltransferase family 2 protein, partial [Chitinophagaceae bacterium]|nr:glycosyltransferase family 2 protein [Chitinophagaceae bacterium]
MTKSNESLISIITPVFNVERFLEETIESVLKQSYSNWELLLIDDGSVDNSPAIAKAYANKYPAKIFYLEHEGHINRGASASRNLGLSKARGDLVSFLDSDDILLPDKLKEQVLIFERMPAASVICEATKYWYSWSDRMQQDIVIGVGAPSEILYNPPELATILYPLGTGASFCTCGLIFRKEVLGRIGFFDESFIGKEELYEDQVFFVKLCLHEKVYIS